MARLEEESAEFLQGESALRSFALRAIGTARGEASLLEEAASSFEAMGMTLQASRTRELIR
jgi:hypothetical protein